MRLRPALLFMLWLLPATLPGQQPAVSPFEASSAVQAKNHIDELVFSRLKELDVQPARPCSDEVFLRRVYLDVIGTLPESDEVRDFLQDGGPNKRGELIERLLDRDEFADYWAMKWCDLLRVKAEFPINLWPNAVQAYHRWIRTAIAEEMPYDQFVRELLTSSGSNFRVPQVNFYRALQNREPKAVAQAVALAFMGTRPDTWSDDVQAGMAACFSRIGYKSTREWKEEIIYFDALQLSGDADEIVSVARLPDGKQLQLPPDTDPRVVFADWLIAPDNAWFAQNAANRVWGWLLGRGIIEPVDDVRPDNPPSNPELLKYLASELVASDYDLKHLYRLILNSQTYQLSSIPRSKSPEAAACFAYYPMRRLDAEVLIDALCQITGATEEYSSPIPEPFTFIPENQRSIALADGSISSPFLELFGRPARDTGYASERNNGVSAAQRLHMLNSSHIRTKLEQGSKLRTMAFEHRDDPQGLVLELYLRILSRRPTARESDALRQYARSRKASGLEVLQDLVWALVNTAEFMYRH